VGYINKKFLNLLAIFMLLGFLSVIFTESCYARNNYELSIEGEPTYELEDTIRIGDRIVGQTYIIHIPIHNSGSHRSEKITVNISDEEGFDLFQEVYINPGVTRDVTFNWSTMLLRNQIIKVYYYPSDTGKTSKLNSGSTSFTIKISGFDIPATSTPGFETIGILFAIIICILIVNKKNRN
jgi:hypothetical protein